MDTAEMLYTRNASDPEEVQRRRPGYPWGNELNVAAVCAGYAFELIFKVMVRVRGGQPEPKHEPSEAYRKLAELAPGDCTEVKRIITSHGWKDASEFLTYLDEHLCDKDRKYWIKPPKGGRLALHPSVRPVRFRCRRPDVEPHSCGPGRKRDGSGGSDHAVG